MLEVAHLCIKIHSSGQLIGPSEDLGNVYAVSGELRNEVGLKRRGPLLILAAVSKRIMSGVLRNRSPVPVS